MRAACQDKKCVKMVQTVRDKLESLSANGAKARPAPKTASPVSSPTETVPLPPAAKPVPLPPASPPMAVAPVSDPAPAVVAPDPAPAVVVPDPAPIVVESQANGDPPPAPADAPPAQEPFTSKIIQQLSPRAAPPPPENHAPPPQNATTRTQSGGSDGAPLPDAQAPGITRVPSATGRRREPPAAPATPVRPRRLSSGESLV